VREQPVIADGEAEACDQPHCEEEADFERPDRAIEQGAKRDQCPDEWQYIEQDKMLPLQSMKMPAPDNPMVAHE
jgi:hypothetical protein